MNTPPTSTAPKEDSRPTIALEAPKPGFMYVQVPDDLRKSAITSNAIAGLCRIGGGDLVAELDEDLQEVVSGVMSLLKPGTLSLKLTFKPDALKRLSVKPKLDCKPPKVETESSILFATEKGQLLTSDPDQRQLNLKIIDMAESDVRTIDD